MALTKIRDLRLYRKDFGTFDEYCRERWGFNKNRANQLIGAAKVNENLTTLVVKPTSERQTRPLTNLEPDQQQEAWQKAVETTPEGKVTAKHVSEVVAEVTGIEMDNTEKSEDKATFHCHPLRFLGFCGYERNKGKTAPLGNFFRLGIETGGEDKSDKV